MGFSTTSTITSATSLLEKVNGNRRAGKSYKRKGDQQYDDQGSFNESVEDESTLPPESEGGFKPVVRRLKQGILCHTFWSLCFDDNDDEEVATRKQKSSVTQSLVSLDGSALEQWQRQQKRENRAWLGLSFSDDNLTDVQRRMKQQGNKNDSAVAKSSRPPKKGAPATIMVSKVTTLDKYAASGDPSYKVEDDVASEVSLDFSEPNRIVKGQRLKIKKMPPKTIQAEMKTPTKRQTRKTRTSADKSNPQVNGSSKSTTIRSTTGSKTQKTKSSPDIEDGIKSNDAQATKTQTKGTSIEELGKAAAISKPIPTATNAFPFKAAYSGKEPTKKQNNSSRTHNTKKTKQLKKAMEENSDLKKNSVNLEEAEASLNDQEDDFSIIPKPRFIPDFSRRELKLRPVTSPPEQLRWKFAEDSRWEYYGDPRRNRVEHWWKEVMRDSNCEEQALYEECSTDDEDHGMVRLGGCYNIDSEKDSYFDRYASEPSLDSPKVANERAEQLARECTQPAKPSYFSTFGFVKRSDAVKRELMSEDDLNDFAEVSDLQRLGPSRYNLTYYEENPSR